MKTRLFVATALAALVILVAVMLNRESDSLTLEPTPPPSQSAQSGKANDVDALPMGQAKDSAASGTAASSIPDVPQAGATILRFEVKDSQQGTAADIRGLQLYAVTTGRKTDAKEAVELLKASDGGFETSATLETGIYILQSPDPNWRMPSLPFAIGEDHHFLDVATLPWDSPVLPEKVRETPAKRRAFPEYPLMTRDAALAKVGDESSTLTVVAERLYELRVLVKSQDGKPIAGSNVKAGYANEPLWQGAVLGKTPDTPLTDSDGKALLRALSGGKWSIRASALGYAQEKATEVAIPERNYVEIILKPVFEYELQIWRSDGSPASGAKLLFGTEAQLRQGRSHEAIPMRGEPDPRGNPTSLHNFRANEEGILLAKMDTPYTEVLAKQTKEVFAYIWDDSAETYFGPIEFSPGRKSVTLAPSDYGTLRVHLADNEGNPVPDARVTVIGLPVPEGTRGFGSAPEKLHLVRKIPASGVAEFQLPFIPFGRVSVHTEGYIMDRYDAFFDFGKRGNIETVRFVATPSKNAMLRFQPIGNSPSTPPRFRILWPQHGGVYITHVWEQEEGITATRTADGQFHLPVPEVLHQGIEYALVVTNASGDLLAYETFVWNADQEIPLATEQSRVEVKEMAFGTHAELLEGGWVLPRMNTDDRQISPLRHFVQESWRKLPENAKTADVMKAAKAVMGDAVPIRNGKAMVPALWWQSGVHVISANVKAEFSARQLEAGELALKVEGQPTQVSLKTFSGEAAVALLEGGGGSFTLIEIPAGQTVQVTVLNKNKASSASAYFTGGPKPEIWLTRDLKIQPEPEKTVWILERAFSRRR